MIMLSGFQVIPFSPLFKKRWQQGDTCVSPVCYMTMEHEYKKLLVISLIVEVSLSFDGVCSYTHIPSSLRPNFKLRPHN